MNLMTNIGSDVCEIITIDIIIKNPTQPSNPPKYDKNAGTKIVWIPRTYRADTEKNDPPRIFIT